MNELHFKRQFCGMLVACNFNPYRIENKLSPGMPDILVFDGSLRAFWVEAKVNGNKLRRTQEIWISDHLRKGQVILEARLHSFEGEDLLSLERYVEGRRKAPRRIEIPVPGADQPFLWPLAPVLVPEIARALRASILPSV